MRSIISSIWREECLAGGAQSQVCRLDPEPCGVVSAPCRLRLVLASSDGDHRAQKPFVNNDEPMLIKPATRNPE
jgi:hypothetical protein